MLSVVVVVYFDVESDVFEGMCDDEGGDIFGVSDCDRMTYE